MTWLDQIHVGDCRALMRRMVADDVKVQCIVTSPPYWGLRDYGVNGQIGLEPSINDWLGVMCEVGALCARLLADNGVLWLNLGDAYGRGRRTRNPNDGMRGTGFHATVTKEQAYGAPVLENFSPEKQLLGLPWRVALALQDMGWYLRSDIIWHKPNPMPESVHDRPTKSHEYIFLMSKSERYFYNAEAIAEPCSPNTHLRVAQNVDAQAGSTRAYGGKGEKPMKAVKPGVNPKARGPRVSGWADGPGSHESVDHNKGKKDDGRAEQGLRDSTKFGRGKGWRARNKQNASFSEAISGPLLADRNSRTVWTMATEAFAGAHFATFPRELAQRCILAGSAADDVVFDPFMGSGTVAEVAQSLGRRFIGCELNPEYASMFKSHRSQQKGMAI